MRRSIKRESRTWWRSSARVSPPARASQTDAGSQLTTIFPVEHPDNFEAVAVLFLSDTGHTCTPPRVITVVNSPCESGSRLTPTSYRCPSATLTSISPAIAAIAVAVLGVLRTRPSLLCVAEDGPVSSRALLRWTPDLKPGRKLTMGGLLRAQKGAGDGPAKAAQCGVQGADGAGSGERAEDGP